MILATMQLSDIIVEKIKNEGPISFCDFMEMCLYYPELGYYNSTRNKIGPEGDYYTSPNLTPLFGKMIALQLEEMWVKMGEKSFHILEYGAGNGTLARDILNYLKNNSQLYENLTYHLIEKSQVICERGQANAQEKMIWHHSIEEINAFSGCILSNELIDNFAVHQVVMQKELMEVFVDYNKGFIEILKPAKKELTDYLSELGVVLPNGFRKEINLQAIAWLKEISAVLKKGYVITIDYGNTSAELYSNLKSDGTLVCYNKHTINYNPYQEIGGQDITSHVNFSALSHWGAKNGLLSCGLTNQANFLLHLGFKTQLQKSIASEAGLANALRKEVFLTHTLLLDMGVKFKVLIQGKGTTPHGISGLNS